MVSLLVQGLRSRALVWGAGKVGAAVGANLPPQTGWCPLTLVTVAVVPPCVDLTANLSRKRTHRHALRNNVLSVIDT